MRRVDVAFLESILVGSQSGNAVGNTGGTHHPALSSSPSSSGPGFLSGASSSAGWSAKQTPFEVLYTAEGFRRVKDWFRGYAIHTGLGARVEGACYDKKNESEDSDDEEGEGSDELGYIEQQRGRRSRSSSNARSAEQNDGYLSERQFVEILRRLADFSDTEALEVFDIFGTVPTCSGVSAAHFHV
jgi:hypothetical protein